MLKKCATFVQKDTDNRPIHHLLYKTTWRNKSQLAIQHGLTFEKAQCTQLSYMGTFNKSPRRFAAHPRTFHKATKA